MKKILIAFLLILPSNKIYGQEKISVSSVMLMQLHIPIQPDDKSWTNWNVMPSLQDSTKTIRIDRMVQGFGPFIARHDAPYYSSSQVLEIQVSLEKIFNPDLYFLTQEEFMKYFQEFMGRVVYRENGVKR